MLTTEAIARASGCISQTRAHTALGDEFCLQRIVDAQALCYDHALVSFRHGSLRDPDVIDCIFPQLLEENDDPAAHPYAIRSLEEARAYLFFPPLGGRYRECIRALLALSDSSHESVFGPTNAKKVHASLTLFSESYNEHLLRTMLVVWFDSRLEDGTMSELNRLQALATEVA